MPHRGDDDGDRGQRARSERRGGSERRDGAGDAAAPAAPAVDPMVAVEAGGTGGVEGVWSEAYGSTAERCFFLRLRDSVQ